MASPLGEREGQIMAVLWEFGEASAEDVRKGLPADIHDSTVRTLLRGLEQKGLVEHSVVDRRFIYRAAITRAELEGHALRSFVDRVFGGSPKALLVRLLEDERVNGDDLREVAKKEARKKLSRRRPRQQKKRKGDTR